MAVKVSAEFAGFGEWHSCTPLVASRGRCEGACQIDGYAVAGFFFVMKMALQFDVDVLGALDAGESIKFAVGLFNTTLCNCRGERAFVAAGQADSSFGVLFEFLCGDRALAFFGAQLHFP